MQNILDKWLVSVAISIVATSLSHAAVFDVVAEGDGRSYTVVEFDTFLSGGTPGNTVRVTSPANFWASTASDNTDGLYRDRDHEAFFGAALPSSDNELYELGAADRTSGPELVTTINGLTPGAYDIYVAYAGRSDGSTDSAGVLANLGSSATTLHAHATPYAVLGDTGTGAWNFMLSSLGTTPDNATDFSVNWKGTNAVNRNSVIGVAYLPTSETPSGPLNVDFGSANHNGGGPGNTQTGFLGFEDTEGGGAATTYRLFGNTMGIDGEVGVKLTNFTHFRDYAAVTGTFASESSLLSDSVLRNRDGVLKLTLDDLLPGTYEIKTYHHNTQSGVEAFDTRLYDAEGSQLISSSVDTSNGSTPASITTQTFQFEAGGSSVMIDFLGGADKNHFSLNGFELDVVALDPLRLQKTDVLALDFNDSTSVPNTQTGFQEFLITGDTTTQTFGSIDVTLNHSNDPDLNADGSIQTRRRSSPTNNGTFSEQELLRDFAFAYGTTADDGLDVLFEGLDPLSRYEVTIWSADDGSSPNRRSDWFANNILAVDDYTFNGGQIGGTRQPMSDETYAFHFLAETDQYGNLLIGGRAAGGTNPNVFLNGISLAKVEMVPEPSTTVLALFGLFAIAMIARRRRRR